MISTEITEKSQLLILLTLSSNSAIKVQSSAVRSGGGGSAGVIDMVHFLIWLHAK